MDSGHRPRRQARRRRSDKSIRNVAYALLSGADGWMFDGEDALGQVSTMSLDNQRNLKLAIHRDAVFLQRRRAGRRRDERWAQRLLRPRDRRRLADAARLHDQDLPRARPAPRRSPRPPRRRRRLLGVDRRHWRCTSSTTTERCAPTGSSIVLYLPKIQTAEEAALWNDMLIGARSASAAAGRHDQGLRAGRAARGGVPADGDSRRARPALRRLQHRPLGLHQQRVRTRWRGIRRSSTRTSTPSR